MTAATFTAPHGWSAHPDSTTYTPVSVPAEPTLPLMARLPQSWAYLTFRMTSPAASVPVQELVSLLHFSYSHTKRLDGWVKAPGGLWVHPLPMAPATVGALNAASGAFLDRFRGALPPEVHWQAGTLLRDDWLLTEPVKASD